MYFSAPDLGRRGDGPRTERAKKIHKIFLASFFSSSPNIPENLVQFCCGFLEVRPFGME